MAKKRKKKFNFGLAAAVGIPMAYGLLSSRRLYRKGFDFEDVFREATKNRPKYKTNYRPGGYTRGASYRPSPPKQPSAHSVFKSYGVKTSKIRTKSEFNLAYRNLARKHHPDAGGIESNMKAINDARDRIRGSSWYEKLAMEITMAAFLDELGI